MFDIFGAKDPQKALQRAHEYRQEGKLESAIKILEANLTEGEESFDLYQELARLYFETEQRGRTVELLRHTQSIMPTRSDEIIALVSGMFYHHASIDLGDFLLELYVAKEDYEKLTKILKDLSDRDVSLLLTRYEKRKQSIESKKVISKKDIENIIIFTTIKFSQNEGKDALDSVEDIIAIETYGTQLLSWARTIARERFNDPYAALLLLKILIANQEYSEALTQAQRTIEKSPDFIDQVITLFEPVSPPKKIETAFTQFMIGLYTKRGDFDTSIERLQRLKDDAPEKIDDVIKSLRELARSNPKNVKILYALGDTYFTAGKTSLAIGEFNKILDIDPDQNAEVVKRYKIAFKKEPNNPLVIQGLVNVCLKQGDVDGAVNIVETAYKSDRGLLDEYIFDLNLVLERKLKNPRALYLLGLCYAHKGDHENANVIFGSLLESKEYKLVEKATEELYKERPDDVRYLNLRARSLARLGKAEEALTLLLNGIEQESEEMIEVFPTLDIIISTRPDLSKKIMPLYEQFEKTEPFIATLATARAYAFTGEYEKSVDAFEKCFADVEQRDMTKRALIEVIREKPDAVPLLLAAARIFLKDGEVEIATHFFKTAQVVDPKAFFEIIDEFYDVLKDFPKDREVRTLLINTFFQRELWDRVIEEAKRAIEVFGKEEQYFNLKLGQALVESGTLSEAVRPLMLSLDGPVDYSRDVIEYLHKILKIDKSNIPAHVALGRALSRARHIDEAVEEYLMTARIVPTRAQYIFRELQNLSAKAVANPRVIFALGQIAITLKKYDGAIKYLSQSCELDPTLVKRVIPLLNKLTKEASSPSLDFALAKAHHIANLKSAAIKFYIKAQTYDKTFREPVISELKKICAENPKDIESRKGLAQIHFDHNNLEDALDTTKDIYELNKREINWADTFVSNILKKNPQHIPSYYFLGQLLVEKKNQKMAIDVYKKLIEISPTEITNVVKILEGIAEKSGELILYLGSLYKDVGDTDRALKLFDELLSIDMSFGEAIVYHIKEILKTNANLADAYVLASKIFVSQKEYERAIEAIKHAVQLMPESEELVLKQGYLYYTMGKAEEAIKVYSELLNKTKDRNAIYRLIKKTREAYFNEKIGMLKGNKDEDRLERANIYLMMNKISDAEKELQFTPENKLSAKFHTVLKAKLYLTKNRPIDALETIQSLSVDRETAAVYADVYEAMGSYEAAATVLRQARIAGVEQRIASYEKLAQERRLAKGRYFIEGRS
jgi:tetratricopeptide (TPR) repeat protein